LGGDETPAEHRPRSRPREGRGRVGRFRRLREGGGANLEWRGDVEENPEKPETGNRKPETGSRKPETGNRKPETGNRKPETGNRSSALGG
jgi:hypothetical protein